MSEQERLIATGFVPWEFDSLTPRGCTADFMKVAQPLAGGYRFNVAAAQQETPTPRVPGYSFCRGYWRQQGCPVPDMWWPNPPQEAETPSTWSGEEGD